MRRRYLVEGEVQGVGFRYFARREAVRLGLAGWVKNLPDGRVEALAVGVVAVLEQFEAALNRGPPMAAVTYVRLVESSDELDSPTSFEIR